MNTPKTKKPNTLIKPRSASLVPKENASDIALKKIAREMMEEMKMPNSILSNVILNGLKKAHALKK